jgi:methyltransferase (TIGR00027 family)
MQDDQPSRTAMRVAVRRAAHQVFDTPRVLDDPIALPIVGPDAQDQLKAATDGQQTGVARAIRAFIVARSRFAEDELERAVARGVSQYVILGAGLDTFAYRNPHQDSLRVFEVDYPATQEWKRRKLAAGGIPVPPSVTYAPIDFETQTLSDALEHVGFRRDAPAFFSWLGVTMYLTQEAIDATLGFVASTPAGAAIVFDYAVPKSSLGIVERLALTVLSRRVAAAGEPFRTFFSPADIAARLASLGLSAIDDLGAAEINSRYFQNREDGLRVSGRVGRVLSAGRA